MKILKLSLKILAGIIALLAILAVLGYFALTRWVNPNSFKPQIVSLVQEKTGRTLTLTGDLRWTIFPNIGIHIGDAALSNPASYSQPTFAEVDSADLLINLGALLHGEVRVNSLTLNGLQVYLMRSATGNNWTFPALTTPAGTTTSSTNTSNSSGVNFKMRALTLNNATFTYDDLQNKTHYELTNFDLAIPKVLLNHPMIIKSKGNFSGDAFSGNFKLNTNLFYDETQNTLALTNLAFDTRTNYLTDSNQNIPIALNLSGTAHADFSNQTLSLSGIQFVLNQVLNGQLSATVKNFSQPVYTGNLVLPTFSLEPLLNSFGVNLPAMPNKDQFANTSFQTDFAGTLSKVALTNLNLGIGNTEVKGSAALNSFSPIAVTENLAINQLDVADFVSLSGARLPLTGISLSGNASVASVDPDDFPSTLNSSQKVAIQDIVLKGFDLQTLLNKVGVILSNILDVSQVATAKAAIQKQIAQLQATTIDAAKGGQTDFGQADAVIAVHNGVVTTPTFSVVGSLMTATGQGTIDLNQETVNYHIIAKILSVDKDIIKSLNIPFNITGPFSNLAANVDLASVQTQVLHFIAGQLGEGVKNVVSTVINAPVSVVTDVGKDTAHAVGDVTKGVSSALGGLFDRHKQAAGS